MIKTLLTALLTVATGAALAAHNTPTISGNYLEVRSCDVYTGPCFANAEMGLTGKEGILVWSIDKGAWNNTTLNGLTVIAVVRADATLGDLRYNPSSGKAVLLIDNQANSEQREALSDFARTMAGQLIREVVDVKTTPMDVRVGGCEKAGCAKVKAGNLVEISTRCLGTRDHLCGNEETFYPPLTAVHHALPVVTELSAYRGDGLGMTWQGSDQRNAFLAHFSR